MTSYPDPAPAAGQNLTQAVDILAFVEAQEIPPDYFETPYFLAPAPGEEQDYALLRETLRRTRKIGIAYVVIQARQHLAALIPHGQSIVLNTLRWNLEGSHRMHRSAPEPVRSATRSSTSASASLACSAGSRRSAPPAPRKPLKSLKQMQVTGCDGYEEDDSEFIEEALLEGMLDSDELRRAFLRPRLHETMASAGRSTMTVRRPHGATRLRRIARRA